MGKFFVDPDNRAWWITLIKMKSQSQERRKDSKSKQGKSED